MRQLIHNAAGLQLQMLSESLVCCCKSAVAVAAFNGEASDQAEDNLILVYATTQRYFTVHVVEYSGHYCCHMYTPGLPNAVRLNRLALAVLFTHGSQCVMYVLSLYYGAELTFPNWLSFPPPFTPFSCPMA